MKRIGVCASLGIALLALQCRRAPDADEIAIAPKSASPVAADANGDNVVKFDAPAQMRMGIEVRALETTSQTPTVIAYGRLAADPARVWELRAPIAGTLREGAQPWPVIGQMLQRAAQIGSLEPRLSALDRIDLASKIAAAKGDQQAATAALRNAEAALERARTLNAEGKNVSDRALQEAQAAADGERAKLGAAREQELLATAALEGRSDALSGWPLFFDRGGEVIDVAAHAGEAVEAGALIVRVARYDELLAEIELPLGVAVDPQSVRIAPLAHQDQAFDGEFVSRGAKADAAAPGARLVARIHCGEVALRPGEAVTAFVRGKASAVEGVVVPRSAVVRFAGKAWAYVRTGDGEFARREIALDAPREDGWFTSAAWSRGAQVVVGGAQNLLSTEMLNAQLRSEAEE
jgi:hypothetical protein